MPVFLSCSEDATANRIGNADRAEKRKITSMQGLKNFTDGFSISAVPRTNCIKLDTTVMTADSTAEEIVRHFGLHPLADSGSAG